MQRCTVNADLWLLKKGSALYLAEEFVDAFQEIRQGNHLPILKSTRPAVDNIPLPSAKVENASDNFTIPALDTLISSKEQNASYSSVNDSSGSNSALSPLDIDEKKIKNSGCDVVPTPGLNAACIDL